MGEIHTELQHVGPQKVSARICGYIWAHPPDTVGLAAEIVQNTFGFSTWFGVRVCAFCIELEPKAKGSYEWCVETDIWTRLSMLRDISYYSCWWCPSCLYFIHRTPDRRSDAMEIDGWAKFDSMRECHPGLLHYVREYRRAVPNG